MEVQIGGVVEPETAALLRALLAELDEIVAAIEELPQALPLYLRAAVRTRLLGAIENSDEAGSLASAATDDCLAGIALAREGLLRGDVEARQMLGDCIRRLATILYWRPDRSLDHLAVVEEQLHDYLTLTAPDDSAAVAAARLAAATTEMVLEGGATQDVGVRKRAIGTCQTWADRAYEILDDLSPPSPEPIALEVAKGLGASLLIAFAEENDPLEAHDFFRLAPRRWRQFETLRDRFATSAMSTEWRSTEEHLTMAVVQAAEKMLGTMDEPLSPEAQYAVMVLIRSFIHRIPPESWDRTGTGPEILERRTGLEENGEVTLQSYLDSLELSLLRSCFVTLRSSIADSPGAAEVGDAAIEIGVSMALFTLATSAPEAFPAYLAAALDSPNHREPVSSREADIAEMLSEMRQEAAPDGIDLEALISLMPFHVASALMAWSTTPTEDVDSLVAQIDGLVREICLPLAQREITEGSRLTAWLITRLTELTNRWPAEDESALLGLLDKTERSLHELGETGPVLALGRAQLALRRLQRIEGSYSEVSAAADALLRHVDSDPELPDDRTAYHYAAVIDTIRLAAIAALGAGDGDAIEAAAPSDKQVDALVNRLLTLGEDPEVDENDRKAAARHVAEIRALQTAMGSSDRDFTPSTWTEVVDNQPTAYLLGIVRATQSGGDAEADPLLVERAIQAILSRTIGLSGLPPDGAAHLEGLTRPEVRSRLQIGGRQAIALGRRATAILDGTDPAAAEVAFVVALNLAGLALSPEVGNDVRRLFEDVAERFLPAALGAPDDVPTAAHFMMMIASLSLNFGAVRETEFSHRLRVALGAHLLATKNRDLDMAARTAYVSGEIYRARGQLADARRWFEVYDYWRAAGALSDPGYSEFVKAIELDRDQLQAAQNAQTESGDVADD